MGSAAEEGIKYYIVSAVNAIRALWDRLLRSMSRSPERVSSLAGTRVRVLRLHALCPYEAGSGVSSLDGRGQDPAEERAN